MRLSSLLPLVVLVGCTESGPPAVEGEGPVGPQENRPPLVSGRTSIVLGEGETSTLGPVFDPDGDPVAIHVHDVTPGLSVELVDDQLRLSLGYDVAVDEDGNARATVDLDDGRGGHVVEDLVVGVASLAWSERARWTSANGPPPRRGAVHLQRDGALYVLFGEEAGVPVADAWRFDPADATWSPVMLVGDVPAPGPGKRVVTRVDPFVHGGVGPDGEPLDDLHRITFEAATVLSFERVAQEAAPPPRAEHLLVAASPSEPGSDAPGLVMFGGLGGTTDAPLPLDDVWTMEIVDGRARWSPASPDVRPPARLAIAVAHDVEGGRAVLFGGRADPSGPPLDETWSLDVRASGAPRFERIEAGRAPAPRAGAAAAWDPIGRRAFVIGGIDGEGRVSDDAFVLDDRGETPEWVAIERSGQPRVGEGAIAFSWTPGLHEDATPRTRVWLGLGAGSSSLHALAPRFGDGYGRR